MYAEIFKIRCSAIGKIMGKCSNELTTIQLKELDRLVALKAEKQEIGKDITAKQNETLVKNISRKNEKPELPETCKNFLKDWLIEQKFGKKREFSNKFTEKGNVVEEEVIDLYSRFSGREFLVKNEEAFSNDFLTGTPDVITDIIVDVKSSWDVFTFDIFDYSEEVKNMLYWWQLQGYMWLKNKQLSELFYGLVDTPDDLILKELNKIKWNLSGVLSEKEEVELEETVRANMTFSEIPEKLRGKTFKIERDEVAIEAIKKRVTECREYIAELEKLEEEKLNN